MIFQGPTHAREVYELQEKQQVEVKQRKEAAELAWLEASQKELNHAEHQLQVGHLKSLTMGEDVMRNIYNDSVREAWSKNQEKKATTKKRKYPLILILSSRSALHSSVFFKESLHRCNI